MDLLCSYCQVVIVRGVCFGDLYKDKHRWMTKTVQHTAQISIVHEIYKLVHFLQVEQLLNLQTPEPP